MFDTEIIDSSKDRGRESAFSKIFSLFDFWLSSLGFILLVAFVTFFLRLAPLVATSIALMFLLLSFVIILIIKFSNSKRRNFGRLILTSDYLQLNLKGREFHFPIEELESLAIYKGGVPGDDIHRATHIGFYGNNWLVFEVNGETHTYEFAIDSNFKEEGLDKIIPMLTGKYRQVSFVNNSEKSEEYGR